MGRSSHSFRRNFQSGRFLNPVELLRHARKFGTIVERKYRQRNHSGTVNRHNLPRRSLAGLLFSGVRFRSTGPFNYQYHFHFVKYVVGTKPAAGVQDLRTFLWKRSTEPGKRGDRRDGEIPESPSRDVSRKRRAIYPAPQF